MGVVNIYQNIKSSDMSQEVYNLGINALGVADEFIDAKITSDEADAKLENIIDRLDRIYEQDNELDSLLVSSSVSNINTYIFLSHGMSGNVTDKDVIKSRNSLAEDLNKKKR